ncbi:hypothetical protein, partial [Mesorhizobium sp. M7A.F.Ca.AU.002.04.1.1]|uniref:hypothetical protein n=1 Tax=Mesorhizobium sp. M7A.F.Ca.AU.002.04.1.1 TaxID=2496673 RepID=UPI000FD5A1B1
QQANRIAWPEQCLERQPEQAGRRSVGERCATGIVGNDAEALEARSQTVDTLVIGGLNEGVWPRKPESDRFMSRLMKTGIDLEPPERR